MVEDNTRDLPDTNFYHGKHDHYIEKSLEASIALIVVKRSRG